jgi:hypothetical protein
VADEKAAEPASPLARAADRIRESAKWLLASFAAVGATLIAGLQLSDIGSLPLDADNKRAVATAVGLTVGLLGVIVAVAAASSVVTKSFVTLRSLAGASASDSVKQAIEGDKALLGGFDSIDELHSAYAAAVEARESALRVHYENPSDPAKATKAEAAQQWARTVGIAQRAVLDQASYDRLRNAYSNARWGILVGAGLTAAGIAAFAWGSNPPEPQIVPVLVRTPTEVLVAIDPEDRASFQRILGSNCDLSAIDAMAVSVVGETYQVVSIPNESCESALFKVPAYRGEVRPKPPAKQDEQASD